MSAQRPNIIFFFTDQQRWDTCGCYGQELDVTPNLDKMADEGVKFEYAYTCQPVCGPARACLQTGKYATETGCFRNDIHLPLDEKTIAHYFNENGYDTAYIGKWHLASTGPEIDHRGAPVPMNYRGGWKDEWIASDVLEFTSHPFDGHMFDKNGNKKEFKDQFRVDAQTDYVIDYLQNRQLDNPFFLFISYLEPHHQNDMGVSIGPEYSKEMFKDYKVPEDLKDREGSWRQEYPDYLGCCHSLDANLGRIREELDKLGIADDTIIIYTSDHGSHFRTRNAEYKRSCHEGCTHIPMVAYGPGFIGGKVIDDLVSLIDIPSTFLNAAGIDVPDYMQGRPLQELADGSATDWPQEVFIQISEDHIGRAIRTKKWKYEVWVPDHNGWTSSGAGLEYVERFLYDLESDPHESNNLVSAPEYKEIRAELAKILKQKMIEANELKPEIHPCSPLEN